MSSGVRAVDQHKKILGEYQLLVPESEQQPEFGILLESGKTPSTIRHLSNMALFLINFQEGEAYFPDDQDFDLDSAKRYLREVCEENSLESPFAYFETSRAYGEETTVGNWEGEWNEKVRQLWTVFQPDKSMTYSWETLEDGSVQVSLGLYKNR